MRSWELVRVFETYHRLLYLYEPHEAVLWLIKPHAGLKAIPCEMLETEPGYDEVTKLINDLHTGKERRR